MLKLYNTLSRKKEDFKPVQPNEAKIYSCGPTVYSFQHIGNMRAAIFQDTVRRSLKFLNYKVTSVQNITDVGHLVSDEDNGEDKMLKAAKKENKDPFEIAKFYTNAYTTDLKLLNVEFPTFMPKATEEIPEQIEMIQNLLDKGFAYIISDGVYFDVSKFEDYGKLSGQSLEEKQQGASERVEENSEKRNPQDFALWKFTVGQNENHIMKWEAPFGQGFPGWHIECSAMSAKYLGKRFDIHTGGIEHISIHHENEIAQNTCSGEVTEVKYWLHNAHLKVNGEKMAKSAGTAYLLKDLVAKGYTPTAFRELNLRTHYRKSLNFTFESLDTGMANVKKINDFYQKIQNTKPSNDNSDISKIIEEITQTSLKEFTSGIEDDLNTAQAMASVYEFMTKINKIENITKQDINNITNFMETTNTVLGLLETKQEIPQEITNLAEERKVAKENKNWAKCDELRDEIQKKGYSIKDDKTAKTGYILSKA
jgi:cysteinyl-tRNA synthetase